MMENSTPATFTAKQIQAINELYDLVFKSEDLENYLALELESIVKNLNRCCGAIKIINTNLEVKPGWIKYNSPDIWELQFENSQSRLNIDVIDVYTSQKPLDENPQILISAILPIIFRGNSVGVFLIGGDPLSKDELSFAFRLLDTFIKILFAQSHMSTKWEETKDSGVIRSLSTALREVSSNPNQAIFSVFQSIRKYFSTEYILFIQKDLETPELIIKKLIGPEDEWIYQSNQHVTADIFQRITYPNLPDSPQDISAKSTILKEILDHPEPEVKTATYVPVCLKNNIQIGALFLLNNKYPIGEVDKDLLTQYSNLVADLLDNWNSIQTLKIDLAKLESKSLDLLRSRNVLRQIFDNMHTSIYIINASYTILAVNIARASRVGIHPASLTGKTCYEVLYGRHTPCPACRAGETLLQGANTQRTWREWISSENHIEWEINTIPIFDETHVSVQSIIQESDITEKQMLEDNLIQSEKLAAVGQLAAGIAHEINNPLAAIIANAQLMLHLNPDDDPDKIESIKLIETAGIRASNVVRNLLNISRKENQNFEKTDINETIQSALMLINHELIKQQLRVETDFEKDMPLLLAHRENLQGVWINLIINAMDAISAAGRSEGVIKIKTAYKNSEFTIIIEDNGNGIEQERIKSIFEPFYTTKKVGHGTGLGLSVCLRTIKEHNGIINVESQVNQGTRFIILIPYGIENPVE